MTTRCLFALTVLVAAAASGCRGGASKERREIRYPLPQLVERPTVPTFPQIRLTVFPLSIAVPADACEQESQPSRSSSAPRRYVVAFRLNATAEVEMKLRSRDGRPLGTTSTPGHLGLNRVCLPGTFLSALERDHAELEVVARCGGSESNLGGLSVPAPPSGPVPGLRYIANIQGGGIIDVAGYYAANDGRHHAILVTRNGKVTEISFTPDDPNSLGIGVTSLGGFASKIVGVAAYYAKNDNYQHVFVGTESEVFELYWNPSEPQYALHVSALLYRPNLTAIAAFEAPLGGWNDKWPQFVVTNANQVTKLTFLKSPTDDYFDLVLDPPKTSLFQPPRAAAFAAYHSSNQQALVVLSVTPNHEDINKGVLALFLPYALGNGNEIGGFYGGNLTKVGPNNAGPPSLAAFSDDDIVITDSSALGDVVDFYPDPQRTSPDCGTRMDLDFFPGSQNQHEKVSWCKNGRGHFDASIIAIAGYQSPPIAQGAGFQNVLVATADGDINLLRWQKPN